MKKFFAVNASKYDKDKNFDVVRASSLDKPANNSVMFITPEYFEKWTSVLSVKDCIIFWPNTKEVPLEVLNRHLVVSVNDPRQSYALFFRDNQIKYNPKPYNVELCNGAYIVSGAKIGKDTVVFPGAYIDGNVEIGDNCYIGAGVKIMGHVRIGNDVIIRENSVIGCDGLTRMRDDMGKVATIPQFGGVVIEDNVQIGALTIIAKGAIDDTVIRKGCRIDGGCFISHNVQLGEDTVIVGETILFGSSSTGKQSFISGNVAIRDGVHIGSNALVAMGSTVIKNVNDGAVVKGTPAK